MEEQQSTKQQQHHVYDRTWSYIERIYDILHHRCVCCILVSGFIAAVQHDDARERNGSDDRWATMCDACVDDNNDTHAINNDTPMLMKE